MQLLTMHTAVREQHLLRTFGGSARPAMEAWLDPITLLPTETTP